MLQVVYRIAQCFAVPSEQYCQRCSSAIIAIYIYIFIYVGLIFMYVELMFMYVELIFIYVELIFL